jgi:hypothetical protein
MTPQQQTELRFVCASLLAVMVLVAVVLSLHLLCA